MTAVASDWRRLVLRRLLPLLAISVAVALVSLAAVAWTSFGSLTAIWPTNALILLAILRGPRERFWTFGVCTGSYIAMAAPIMYAGAPLIGAMIIALTNILEIATAVWLLGAFRLMDRDLTRPTTLVGFLLCAAVIAPAAGAGAATPLVAGLGGGAAAQVWWDYWSADALGVMILVPFGMVLTREHLSRLARSRDLIQAAGLLAALAVGCFLLVRSDATQLALLTPLAILATLRFGALGAAGSVLWAGLIAIALNLTGFGTVAADSPDIRAELFNLQIGLAMLPLATLPVAAVLAERDRAARAAQAADRAKSEFLANMSHEIRTPLNGVVGMSGLLSQSASSPREREIACVIHASGLTLERLLSDVLDLARMEAGGLDLRTETFDLGETLRLAVGLASEQAAGKPLTIEGEIAPEADTRRLGDAARVRQVVSTLLSNAVKFTDAGQIRLIAAADGDYIRLTVSDTGCGFDPAHKAEVFGRFQQADGSITRRHDGAGMGLAIARHVVERMGGSLDAESVPGEGSVFTAILPLGLPAAKASTPLQAPSELAEGRPLRILLADDHPTNRKVVELILAQADIDLIQVENGAEAVDAFRAAPFDLVLMDMQMPVMDGLTAVRAIRAHEAVSALPRRPILMLTANALPEHAEASLAAGADQHLTKPITPPDLFAAIEQALSSAPEALAA
ncbi:signal transduction histidine kinase/ActR/RegA family two-component response regulator [Brevundimonas alba]|uniref:histidine kinase n=1 Tax=Brevundimonas alba TaxID=74314 RepID=A0A7X6BNT8_9CAUL|nr:ATP-binding protein [Brevundimonas alba]NJC40821.1 signal transduction histidine kinase/ActR/RegA family two-component response regulator [Brevundimonas alba]